MLPDTALEPLSKIKHYCFKGKRNFRRVNDSFEQILGYSSEELFDHPYVNLILPV